MTGACEAERSEAQSDPRSEPRSVAVRLQLLLLERLKLLPGQRAVVEQPLQVLQPCKVHHDGESRRMDGRVPCVMTARSTANRLDCAERGLRHAIERSR